MKIKLYREILSTRTDYWIYTELENGESARTLLHTSDFPDSGMWTEHLDKCIGEQGAVNND